MLMMGDGSLGESAVRPLNDLIKMAADKNTTRLRLVLLDIEGTTLPISYVQKTLFPYAAARLQKFVEENGSDPLVRTAIGDVQRLASDRPPIEQLLEWLDEDRKEAPLKTLQGLIWKQGYESGDLETPLYPDVGPVLQLWKSRNLRLAVYSSGSVMAQRLIYGHTSEGDLSALFEAFFDLDMGPKKVAESYTAIAHRAGLATEEILFLSDSADELRAAGAAGCAACQLVRPEDGTEAAPGFDVAETLADVAQRWDEKFR